MSEAAAVDGGASDLDKLRIVSEAYKKLQAQSAVLKKAVVAEQARSSELSTRVASLEAALSERTADVRSKEIELRRVLEAKDALEFNNQSLAKRLASLAAAPATDAVAATASSEQDDLVLALQKELALKLAELAQLQARVPALEASELRLAAVQRELADATAKVASIDVLRADLAKQTARADALASRLLALARERDDVDAQRKAALEQARVAAAQAADLVRQRDAVGASLSDLLAPPLPETLQPVLTLTADEWDGNGSAFARTLGARNCAVPSFDRAALIQGAVGQLVALVGGGSGSSGSGAANATQSTPSLVQRVSESIAAAERAYDVRNRAVDAGVELITANGNAMTALRTARDSLLALCDVGAMFAKHAREPAALDRLLAALDDYAAAASAAAAAQSKSAVAASSTPGCAAAVASALVGVAAAFSALSTAATDAAAMPRRWKAILFGDDIGDAAAANEPVCHAAVALGACRGLRLLLDAQRRATAALRALAQTERQSGAALPDALAFNDAVVACAAAVDDSLEDVARHFRRIAALLAAPRSATLVRGVLVAAGTTADERALIAAHQQSRVAEAVEFVGRSAPRHRHRGVTMIERDLTTLIASTTAAISSSSGGGGGGATSAAAGAGNDGNTAPRYEQRYSIAVIDELGNTNEQLRLSAVDRDREKQMKLFYEQKAAALLAQITAADNRALELQMQNFQFKQELDEVRRKMLVRPQ
jgi:hypothetical protein